jgi:hypothetical protein
MLFLVEAKRLGVQSFTSFIPKAVGQAIALLKVSGYVITCCVAFKFSLNQCFPAFRPSVSVFLTGGFGCSLY